MFEAFPRSALRSVSAVICAACISSIATAQTPPASGAASPAAGATPSASTTPAAPTDQSRLDQAIQAAADAAKAAGAAAVSASQVAQAFVASQTPKLEAPVPCTPPGPPPKLSPWSGHFGANVLAVTGNANAVTGSITAKVMGEWPKWQLTLAGDAAYGQANITGTPTPQVTALNADFFARGERDLGSVFSAYLQAGVLTDHVASIELQSYGEAGVGITWLEQKAGDYIRAKIKTDVGFRYMHESDYQYYPELVYLGIQDVYAMRIAASFHYALSKVTVFSEDVEVLPDLVDAKDVRVTSTTAIAAQVAGGVALTLSFKVRYIGVPAAGAKPTDTALGAGVSYTF